MKGKIVLNLAMSIDGYIADEKGGYDWIAGYGNSALNTSEEINFNQFLDTMNVVVMGKNCYDQGFAKDFPEKDIYVATHQKLIDKDNIHFVSEDIVGEIEELKEKGQNIFLFGGGILIDSFMKKNVIDEYIIGIIPVLLGKGRLLFLGNNPMIRMELINYSISDGIGIFHYQKK